MKRLGFGAAIFLMPILGIFTLGCGGSDESTKDMPPSSKVAKKTGSSSKSAATKEAAGGGGGGGGGAAAGSTELESTASGTLKRTNTFDGTPPAQTAIKMEKHPDYCR